MRITNRHHLPAAIVQAVSIDPYPHGQTGDISATSLIAPPQLVALKRQFADALEEDAADRIWALFGQSIHAILERADLDGLHEIRLFAQVNGWAISGQVDRLATAGQDPKARIIEDYIRSFVMQITRTWTAQTTTDDQLSLSESRAPNEIQLRIWGPDGYTLCLLDRKEWEALMFAIRDFKWSPTPEEEQGTRASMARYLASVQAEAA